MYNFVIFSSSSDYYDVVYHDIKNLSNVDYVSDLFKTNNIFLKICFKINFYFQGKMFPNNPLISIWNRFLFESKFDNDNPICFVFTERVLFLYNYGFIDFLRNSYPNAKFVCFLQDLCGTIKNINLDLIFKEFDLSISYDKAEAEKYNILYHHTPYSSYPLKLKKKLPKSDVFFVGRAKNRLGDIINSYEKLKKMGLSCDFYITDVDTKDQKYSDEIKYNKRLTYRENLEHVKSAKFLLEIMQKDASGFSLRTWEAIFYEKFLLTNNASILKAPFYKNKYIFVYDTPQDFEKIIVQNLNKKINYNYKEKLNPKCLLDFIENNLKVNKID